MFTEITDSEFESSIGSGTNIVLFYKEKCPFCNAMKKILTKFSSMPAARDKQINYYSINRETCPVSVETLNVERIPAVFVFKDGKKVADRSGDVTYRQLEQMIA